MDVQDLWDFCAQNKASEISTPTLSGFLGLLCAEQDVEHLNKINFLEFWDSCAQNRTSEISKNAVSGIMGLLCAEQDVGNLKKWTFRNSGTPVRRTRRRKSQKMDVQEFWDSCAQHKTSEISKNVLSQILGLLCAEQDVGNRKKLTFRNSGTPVSRTKRRKSRKMTFKNSGTPVRRTTRRKYKKQNGLSGILGLLCAEQNVGNLKTTALP